MRCDVTTSSHIFMYNNDLEGFRDGRRAYKYKAKNFKSTIFLGIKIVIRYTEYK